MEFTSQFDESLLDDETLEQEEVTEEQEEEEIEESPEQEEEEIEDEESEEEEELVDYSDNPVYSFLQSKGISDPSKIQFEAEDGSIEERDFNSLTKEEQTNILNQVSDPGISDYEYNVINYLRKNNTSLEQVIDYFSRKAVDDYLAEHPEDAHKQVYSIDDYTDDELYVADLKAKYPGFTDEELISKLDSAKTNEDLFNKEVETLRKTYKEQEDADRAAAEQRTQQEYADLQSNLNTVMADFNGIALDYKDPESDSLTIDNEDKQQMMSYLLDQDTEGKSQLIKDLEDPNMLIEIAWLRTRGADALSDVTRYYKGLLAEERKETKKLASQLERLKKKGNSTVVSNSSNTNTSILSGYESLLDD